MDVALAADVDADAARRRADDASDGVASACAVRYPARMIADDVERLRDSIAAAKVVVPFTGAGVSTESGIPDFRSPGGLWTTTKPIDFHDFVASQAMRDEAWRRRFAMQEHFAAAKPNRGHRALASLYRAGKTPAVITQNIDNLHQVSGFPPEAVVELHGNTTYALCLGCGKRYELAWVEERFNRDGGRAPDCSACGGHIKTATVSFGQSMPAAAMELPRMTRWGLMVSTRTWGTSSRPSA